MKEKKQTITVDKEISLLDAIYEFKKEMSKKSIKNFIKNKMVRVNDKVITNSSHMLNKEDIIEISYEKKVIPKYDLDILYEDEYLIAINKPCGLLSISNDKEKDITAYRMVSDYVKSNNKKNFIFVLHRLDQDTSGVLMFSKNEKIRDKMQDNWNNVVKKRGYVTVVDGKLSGSGTFRSFLMEDRKQFVYSSKNGIGKEAITHYSVITNNKDYSMLQVFIDTGRRNQIRVHLSEHGYPIVGDKKYRCKTNPIKRLCLHANILEFIHPVSKKIISIKCDIPSEFKKLVK
ncbi:MAG: RluA family pseudouridine synthase [Bacilli bacterium]|nr:RluA family pseudouridine synthase [Bacilli bacterium]